MIQGLRFKFTPEELKIHMLGRAAYHGERADLKEKEIPKMQDIAAQLKATTAPEDVQQMAKGYMNTNSHNSMEDVIKDTIREVRDHRNKALAFKLFSEHLMTEDYDLGEQDLKRLEILN